MKSCKNSSSAILIERKQPNGRIRLIVQLYASGVKSQESTGIMIEPTDSIRTKREKRELAEDYRRKREEELKNFILGVKTNESRLDDSFIDYYDQIMLEHDGNTVNSWNNSRNYLVDFQKDDISFRFITKDWVRRFRDYLLTAKTLKKKRPKGNETIMRNTAANIYQKIVYTLNRAVADEIIPYNPCNGIQGIAVEESLRTFLDEDELKRLMDTECNVPDLKRAFMFSCFTGLRFSDVSKLSWSEVKSTATGYSIAMRMKKTATPIYQDISEQASKFLGKRTDGLVFAHLYTNAGVNKHLKIWAANAGLDKSLTFHMARHTFATLLLKHNADLYTVSKLLGHRKITTTQIYAKVVDETKRNAVNSLNNILNNE